MTYRIKISLPTKKHYVYAYYVDKKPFYIGVGTGGRYLHHLHQANNPFLRRKLDKLYESNAVIEIKILFESSKRGKANAAEVKLIKKFGKRKDGGTLCNIAAGGDGGDTYQGRRMFYNKKTGERKAFHEGKEPEGWVPGTGRYTGPRVSCYHPKSGQITRVYTEDQIPEGFVKGLPRGRKTGPTGKVVMGCPKTGKHLWVVKGTPLKDGWVWGKLHEGSTKDKVRWWNPKTGKSKFLPKGQKEKGWIKGTNPEKINAKPVKVGKKVFPSIKSAAAHFGLSRYYFEKRINFSYVDN